jgi:hypothetical protein
MKNTIVLSFFALLALCMFVSADNENYPPMSIGDRLVRDYTKYYPLPITVYDADGSGWVALTGDCDDTLGIAYTQSGGATVDNPVTLFFTSGGQISGIGVNLYGSPPQNLIDSGYWQELTDSIYFLSITFRSSGLCTGYTSSLSLGNQLVINANTTAIALPLTDSEAEAGQWTKGSCFSTMGYHYFYDLSSAPYMSWEAANLLPIVPMYFNGSINAFFFASSVVQQSLLSAHWWDPIPLLDILMCKNWCDSSCTWSDTSAWSTFHVYLRDYTEVTCPGGCTIACCS